MVYKNRLFIIIGLSILSFSLVASEVVQKAAEAVRRIQERNQQVREMVNQRIAEARYGADQRTVKCSEIITRAWLASIPEVPDPAVVRSEEFVRRTQERNERVRDIINEHRSRRLQEQALFNELEEFQKKQWQDFKARELPKLQKLEESEEF